MRKKGKNVVSDYKVRSNNVNGRKGMKKKVVKGDGEGSSKSMKRNERVKELMENGKKRMEDYE